MSSPRINEILARARELAIEGDYSTAMVYYEECKIQFEKSNGFTLLPSQKRMYDMILAEMTELNGLIEEINSIHQITCQSTPTNIISDFNRKKSEHDNSATQPLPKKILKVSSQPNPRPRFTVDERGHRLSTVSPIKGRMTVPVRRQSIQVAKNAMPLTESSANLTSELSIPQQYPSINSLSFIQQYKGVVDVDLIRMLESEVVDHSPCVSWDQIAGLQHAREVLEEAFVLPQWMPELFQGIRRPWKGILLFGPPGTGKTLLAKAIATECNTTFFSITSSTLTSKWRGDSEKLVKLLFEMAHFYAPSTVFIDEVDAMGGQRGNQGDNEASLRVKSELLIQMDGIASSEKNHGNVTVLGATNLPWNLDEALRRRFEKRIYIPLPEKEQRKELFKICLKSVDTDPSVNFDDLAERTTGYSGADITTVCRDASMMTIRSVVQQLRKDGVTGEELQKILRDKEKNLQTTPVTQNDLVLAIEKISSSVGTTDIQRFESWMKEYGSV